MKKRSQKSDSGFMTLNALIIIFIMSSLLGTLNYVLKRQLAINDLYQQEISLGGELKSEMQILTAQLKSDELLQKKLWQDKEIVRREVAKDNNEIISLQLEPDKDGVRLKGKITAVYAGKKCQIQREMVINKNANEFSWYYSP